ncbi:MULTISPECIES: VOC family protein [unclassified Micromonospora]|uniref:VOC family protein n=1 Tax=unclassified Micromonospora TaxID=2617518 RepID=UPI001033756B|nr:MULTISPECIES: VOC family protein [unclassified Micromonospora]QKW13761.1 VOC family protein [Verrucosispora sp. NA02020]TBL36011.1 VOC family protein [Verrucosispora sp. SN26_14.1]
MTVLKTYARLWVDDLDTSLPSLRTLVGAEPDLRFGFDSVELAALGDFLVIAGPPAQRARYAHASATVVVDDLDAVVAALTAEGGVITTPEATSPTGRYLYVRHAGGAEVEYVEWVPELVDRIVTAT